MDADDRLRGVVLTGVQALGDRGGFDQVTSTQVTGDEMVKVSHQVLPSCGGHVWSFFFVLATLQEDTEREAEGRRHLLDVERSHVHSQPRGMEAAAVSGCWSLIRIIVWTVFVCKESESSPALANVSPGQCSLSTWMREKRSYCVKSCSMLHSNSVL